MGACEGDESRSRVACAHAGLVVRQPRDVDDALDDAVLVVLVRVQRAGRRHAVAEHEDRRQRGGVVGDDQLHRVRRTVVGLVRIAAYRPGRLGQFGRVDHARHGLCPWLREHRGREREVPLVGFVGGDGPFQTGECPVQLGSGGMEQREGFNVNVHGQWSSVVRGAPAAPCRIAAASISSRFIAPPRTPVSPPANRASNAQV